MRYVSTENLELGMSVARDVYKSTTHHTILLKKGAIINSSYIDKLMRHNISGVFIMDGIDDDVEVAQVLTNETKEEALNVIKDIYARHLTTEKLHKSIEELSTVIESIINSIADFEGLKVGVVDLKKYDDYTYNHSLAVAIIAIAIARNLGLDHDELYKVGVAGILHDIGKTKISHKIINKPGKLSLDEMIEIKTHALAGGEYLLKHNLVDYKIYDGVISHHERWDGKGYPYQLKGEAIALYGRILAVADVYEALTSNRSYREAKPPSDAYEYIIGAVDTHFDRKVVEAFTKTIEPYPLGCCILLSNNDVGLVIENFSDLPLRPKVRSIYSGRIYDLATELKARSITIVGEFRGIEDIDEFKKKQILKKKDILGDKSIAEIENS